MRRFGALAMMCGCLLAGCDGGGSDPTSPGPPANVAGTWVGSGLIRSAGPAGNCVADFFQTFVLVGFADNVTATITQNGAVVAVGIDGLFTPSCDHSGGMVSGNSIAAGSGTCGNAGSFTCGTVRAEVRSGTSTFNATVSGTHMSGTRDFVLNTFDLATGASLGAVNMRETVELDRR